MSHLANRLGQSQRGQPQLAWKYAAAAIPLIALVALLTCALSTAQEKKADPPRGQKQSVPQAFVDRLKLSPAQITQVSKARGSTVERFAAIPVENIPRAVRRANFPDLPSARAAFRSAQQRDERGLIPAGAQVQAITQFRELAARNVKQRVAGMPTGAAVNPNIPPPLTAGVESKKWVSIGPGNVGGRVRSIIIHPTAVNTMWAASVAGGIWRTDNAGKTWDPVDDFMVNLAVTSIVLNPANPNEMYAGTGEGFFNADAIRGAGIFKSTDGGVKWSLLASTEKPEFYWVNRVAIAPSGSGILAATRGEAPGGGGLYRSSDGGTTWDRTLEGDFADVKFDPKDMSKAVAASHRDGAAYYSTDGGKTWKLAVPQESSWTGRVELTYAAKDSKIVYASVDQNGGEVWRSEDGGITFTVRHSGSNYLGEQGWYDNVIWAGDQANADFVIVGGIDLWRSTDGGKTLSDISTWWAGNQASAHADHHVIVAHPQFGTNGNKAVFFGNDGGVYTTTDVYKVGNNADQPRTNGWKELVNMFGITQCYGAAGNPSTGVIVAGMQDNGTQRFDPAAGGEKFTEMFGGDGGYCAADSGDPNFFYGEYVYLNIHRSMDGGKTADYISGQYWNSTVGQWQWKPVPYTIPDARFQRANFIAPFILDPNETNRILGGGRELWRTNDAKTPSRVNPPAGTPWGPAWTSIKPSVGVSISAIAVARGNSDHVWVGHNDGQVFVSSNGTADAVTWKRIGAPGPSPLPLRYCHRIVINPKDHKQVFVCFGGYSKGNVWRTNNGGQTWEQLGATLPAVPVRTLAIHPNNGKFLYIGTEVGIFASEDGGANWSPTNEGPTNCSVDELFWMDTKLTAATHGRGLFQIDLKLP